MTDAGRICRVDAAGPSSERTRRVCHLRPSFPEAAPSAARDPCRLPAAAVPRRAAQRSCLRTSFQIQWANFSSWLIAGGLLFGGFALLWALVDLARSGRGRRGRAAIHFAVLLAMWVLGFVNALVHAKDAFAIMPEALYLSAIAAMLALVAAWIGYSGFQSRAAT